MVEIAQADLSGAEVLEQIDYSSGFDLLKIPTPAIHTRILERLSDENLIVARPGGRFDITNLGAILLAKDLSRFDRLGRKTLRIIKYRGKGRTDREREWQDAPARRGYALAFDPAAAYVRSLVPHRETIGRSFRPEIEAYPTIAIRELLANALIHQNFYVGGTSSMVEIFEDRIEITNPGEPLVPTIRFIDTPPRSRNEGLAALMRRMNLCEEGGTGIDKVIEAVEHGQLPAPNFTTPPGFTRVILYGPRPLGAMDLQDRIRACYQHRRLLHVSGQRMTNATLRQRLGINARRRPA